MNNEQNFEGLNVSPAIAKPMLAADLSKFLIWLHYNKPKIEIDIDVNSITKEFIKATRGKNQFCKCKNKSKAVNAIWIDWHCTYCLKPKSCKK